MRDRAATTVPPATHSTSLRPYNRLRTMNDFQDYSKKTERLNRVGNASEIPPTADKIKKNEGLHQTYLDIDTDVLLEEHESTEQEDSHDETTRPN